MKRCTRCGRTKPLSEFHRDRSHPDGRMSRCAECERERKRREYAVPFVKRARCAKQAVYDAAHRERKRAYDREMHRRRAESAQEGVSQG